MDLVHGAGDILRTWVKYQVTTFAEKGGGGIEPTGPGMERTESVHEIRMVQIRPVFPSISLRNLYPLAPTILTQERKLERPGDVPLSNDKGKGSACIGVERFPKGVDEI